MLRVCSAGACTGWSKYTLASVTVNQPDGPFPLPLIEIFSVRYVHIATPLTADDNSSGPRRGAGQRQGRPAPVKDFGHDVRSG
jgi:hypothetical protein